MEPTTDAATGADLSGGVDLVEHTFLFTDIEGSTPLWERNPKLMSRALLLHDESVAAPIESSGGIVVKHTGDGILARYDSSASALDGALAMQRSMRSIQWPEGFELRLRIGLHHGHAEGRGNDFYGRDVNLAARVMSAAAADQILVSDAVAQRVAASDRYPLRDEGRCSLKGISEPVRLWTLLDTEADQQAAPVARLGPGASTIPVVPDDLVGRGDELASVAAALGSHRLVTLIGAPGAGKTRLAIAAAIDEIARHPGGVHVVELAPLRDAAQIGDTVAAVVLGKEPIATEDSAIERLTSQLADDTLIVLDNCEHLVDDVADFVSELLAASARVRLLLTSRESLLLSGEQVIEIEPLGLGVDGSAVQLFMQRARAMRADLTDFDTGIVADLCGQLDGLPLAIELAAARLDVLSLEQLRDRLFDVLGSPRRSRRRRDDRHATIESAVRWSWELLDDDERLVLARASVFVGSFDLAAANRVCGGDEFDPVAVIDLIGMLQDRSFISSVWEESGNRFRLLEVVRTFAANQLGDNEAAAARRRHQDHFAELSSQLSALFDAKPDPAVIAQLELDDDNFVAALQLTDDGGLKTARKLATQLHTYWEETGRLPEAYQHVSHLIEPPAPRSGLWRAVVGLRVTYGAMVGHLDEVAESEAVLQELVGGAPEIAAVDAYFALGFAALGRGAMDEAAEWFDVAAEVVAPFSGHAQRQALMTAGACLAYGDDPVAALARYQAARAVPPPEQGWFDAYATVFEASAQAQAALGSGAVDPSAVDDWCEQMDRSLRALRERELGFRVTVAAHQAALAFAVCDRRVYFDRWAPLALRMGRDNGHRWAVALGVELSAWSAVWSGDDEAAIAHWAIADRAFAESGYGLPQAHRRLSAGLRALVDDRVDGSTAATWRAAAAGTDLAVHVASL